MSWLLLCLIGGEKDIVTVCRGLIKLDEIMELYDKQSYWQTEKEGVADQISEVVGRGGVNIKYDIVNKYKDYKHAKTT